MDSPITILIIIATAAISYKVMQSQSEKMKLIFSPYKIMQRGEYYRFLSSGFIHADWLHLIFNMYVLYEFGKNVEIIYKIVFGTWGILLYVLLYFGGIVAAHIPNFIRHRANPAYGSLGASGAVSGILFASILFDPWGEIGFLFLPGIGIPGFIIGALYLWYSSYMSKKSMDNIDHLAHFAGAVFGFLFTIIINPAIFPHFLHCLTNRSSNCILEFLQNQM